MSEWKKVVFASDCRACEACGEPVCPTCHDHYADCECPGPTQDDMYEYREDKDILMARELPDDDEDIDEGLNYRRSKERKFDA